MDGRINPSVVVPWLLSLVTVAVGIWQFASQQEQANKAAFLGRQMTLCFEASEAAARLASETDRVEWEKARKTFWRLYWGPLAIVEDRDVAAAMVDLGKVVPVGPAPQQALPMRELEIPSLRLGHAARRLILASWKVDLPPLQGMDR